MLIDILWRMTRPLLFRMEAERAHDFVLERLGRSPRFHAALLGLCTGKPDPRLAKEVAGLKLAGPIGLAAGLDKNGVAIPTWASMGFGFVEVGTVTPRPQPGNPRPRMFRLVEEGGIINRMGFNNHGSSALAEKLSRLHQNGHWPKMPVGANIGKNKDTPLDKAADDYRKCAEELVEYVDYLTVNVSSPNTPGLRELQQATRLTSLLGPVVERAASKPVFLKLAPDIEPEHLESAVEVAIDTGCSGLIATNTTIGRPDRTGRLGENGGLSGAPLWELARRRIADVLTTARGRLPVVGVGGIRTAEQVETLLSMGCEAVQIYSGLIFEGPGLPHRLNRHLLRQRRLTVVGE